MGSTLWKLSSGAVKAGQASVSYSARTSQPTGPGQAQVLLGREREWWQPVPSTLKQQLGCDAGKTGSWKATWTGEGVTVSVGSVLFCSEDGKDFRSLRCCGNWRKIEMGAGFAGEREWGEKVGRSTRRERESTSIFMLETLPTWVFSWISSHAYSFYCNSDYSLLWNSTRLPILASHSANLSVNLFPRYLSKPANSVSQNIGWSILNTYSGCIHVRTGYQQHKLYQLTSKFAGNYISSKLNYIYLKSIQNVISQVMFANYNPGRK